jgi:hypothetical protein
VLLLGRVGSEDLDDLAAGSGGDRVAAMIAR